jgi:hypothetical protein
LWAVIGIAGIAGLVLYGWTLWKLPDRMHLRGAQDRYNARVLVISAGGAFAVAADLTRANLRDVRGLLGEQLQVSRTGEFPDLTGRFDRPRWSRTPGPRDQAADG